MIYQAYGSFTFNGINISTYGAFTFYKLIRKDIGSTCYVRKFFFV